MKKVIKKEAKERKAEKEVREDGKPVCYEVHPDE